MSKPRWRVEAPLLIAALFISFVIWLMAKASHLQTTQLEIPVSINNIPGNVKLDFIPHKLEATVKHPQRERGRVAPQNFGVILNYEDIFGARDWASEGDSIDQALEIATDQVIYRNLPPTVQITDFGPQNHITIHAELYTQTFSVKPTKAGALPPLYELVDLKPNPAEVVVTASPQLLQKFSQTDVEIPTSPVDLNGRDKDFSVYCELRLPPDLQLVNASQKNIEVLVTVREKEEIKDITDIPIRIYVLKEGLDVKITPPLSDVRIRGKISALDRINRDSFEFKPTQSLPEEAGEIRKRVELEVSLSEDVPLEVREALTIENATPKYVDIQFIADQDAEVDPQ